MSNSIHESSGAIKSESASDTNEPVNICFIIDNLGTGGTETYVLQQIAKMDPTQFRCHLCLLDGTSETSKQMEPENVPVIRLGVRKLKSLDCFKAMKSLKEYLRKENIQLIQTHFFDSTLFGVLAAKWAGRCRIVKTRRDLIFFGNRFQRWFGRPIHIVFNRLFVDGYIANSEDCKNALITQESIGKLARIEVIPNGVDLERFHSVQSRIKTLPPEQWRVGIVSMMRPEKNVALFVEMAALVLERFPTVKFLVAGDGPDRKEIAAKIDRLGINGQVELCGRVANVPEFLRQLQIGVLSSETEGMPNSVVEYMAAGNTVVATAVGGTCELIQDRRNGLLVPSNDAPRMAKAVVTLIENPELCYDLAKTARYDVEQNFDVYKTMQRHKELYRGLIDAK